LLAFEIGISQPSWQWANAINSTQDEKTLDITTMFTSGETYACGYFDGDLSAVFTLGLNGTPNMSAPIGTRDGFVAKYDIIGNVVWAFKIGGIGATVEIEAITDAPNGNIYVTGEFFNGPVDFQGVVSSISNVRTPTGGSKNMFLAAYNSNGELLWATSSIDTGNSIGFGITADVNGIYVVGRFAGDITFPPLAPVTWTGVASFFDAYITKFDYSGNAIRVKTIFSTTGDGHVKAFNIATDGNDVYAVGTAESTAWTFGPTGLNPSDNNNGAAGSDDIWIISIRENNFNLNWSQVIGGIENDVAKGLANDVNGLYLTGGLGGASVNFPGIAAVASVGIAQDIFTSKLFEATGLTDWVFMEQNNSATDTYGSDIVIDAAGDLYITGSHTDTTDFNSGLNSIPTIGGLDVFVMSRKNTGVFNWAVTAGGLGNDEGFGIGIDNSGSTYIGGSYDLISAFGTINLVTDAQNNGFVAKLNLCSLSIVCPANQTVTADALCQFTLLDYTAMVTPFASCGISSVKQIPIPGTVVNSGINPITVYLTDNNGNLDSCTFDLVVESAVNPTVVSCGTNLIGETTVGSGDTENNFSCVGFGTPGEDIYYQVTVPAGNFWLQITMDNAVDANDALIETFWVGGSCPLGGGCLNSNFYDIATQQFSTGGNSVQYLAVGPGTYYFVVDAQNDGIDSYDIRFDCLESGIEFDTSLTCGDPNNDGIIPYVDGSTILTTQTCQSVTICHDIFIANQTDFQWMDSIYMDLGSCYTNVVPTTVVGFYEPGNWVGVYDGSANSIAWQFNNTSVPNWGDGYTLSYSCDNGTTTMYSICFTTDISSTCTLDSDLNISMVASDDGVSTSGNLVASITSVVSNEFVITNPPPSIVCLSDTSVNNDAGLCSAVINGLFPARSDNCPGPFVTYTMTGATVGSGVNDVSGTTFNMGVTTVKYTVTDSTGNQDSCLFTVTVNDNENPILTCPSNINIPNDFGICTAVVNGIAPITLGDNCILDSVSYTLIGATVGSGLNDASGITFNLGITTVTYTVVDTSGNTTSCNFTITVSDVINPTISCVGNINVNNDLGNCGAIINGIPPTGISDNCAIDSVSYILTGATSGSGLNNTNGVLFNIGLTTVTYMVTDISGNISTCNFTITVTDNELPSLMCSSDISVNNDLGNCSAIVSGIAPTAFGDNCSVDSVSYVLAGATIGGGLNDASGTIFNVGLTTITYTIYDLSGNSNTCNFNVTVIDSEVPTFSCPSNSNVFVDANCNFSIPDYTSTITGLSDNCSAPGVIVVTQFPFIGTIVSGAATNQNITLYATDVAGNTDSCTFIINLIDTLMPTISCPGSVNVNNDVGFCGAIVSGIAPTSINDNCIIDSVSYVLTGTTLGSGLNDASGTFFNAGLTTVTYTIIDVSGNSETCSFTVIVVDNEPPSITCSVNINVNNDAGLCNAVISGIAPIGTNDNCTIDSVSYVLTGATSGSGLNDASGTSFSLGVTTVTYTIIDMAGNTNFCSFIVTVSDIEAPTFNCPANINESLNFFCSFSIPNYATTLIGLSDNCTPNGGITITQSPLPGTTISGHLTTQNITLYAMDASNNIDSCSFIITLQDTISPTMVCNGNQSELVNNNCAFVLPSYTPFVVNDNCTSSAAIAIAQIPTVGTIITSDTLITLIADDGNGNTTSCTFMVLLSDTISPVVICPSDTIVNNDVGVCDANIILATPINIDNCAVSSIINNYNNTNDASDIYPIGNTTIVWTVTDNSSNTSFCSFDITVIDAEKPIVNCINDTIINTDNNSCDAVFNYAINSSDNCSSTITQIAGLPSGSIFPQGITTNTFIATDLAGLTDTCSFTITVNDNQSPTIICPNDIVLCDKNVIIPLPDLGDNCGVASVINDYNALNDASDVYPVGITLITFTVSDNSGNVNSCVMSVEVEPLPTVADAGENQHVLISQNTNFEANTSIIGIGSWSEIYGGGIIDDDLDPLSLVSSLLMGENIFRWTIKNGTCPESYDEVTIVVGGLDVPTGFSPNGDDINDLFVVPGLETFNNEVIIFNRWGVEIYNQGNYQNDWEGISKDGKTLPEDTYFYIIKLLDFSEEYSGYVVIKR
jgi:gliding motility-associated-like protein